jgi:hypothetical protein
MPLVWFGGAPIVVLAFIAHWISTRCGRPRIGRVSARVAAALILVTYGIEPLGFAADMAIDRECLDTWGGLRGVEFFLAPDLAPTVAAFCVLAAVRTPKHRVRRLLWAMLRARWFRRSLAAGAALGMLSFLPVRDLEAGAVTTAEQCGHEDTSSIVDRAGERAFVCQYRRTGQLSDVSDHHLVAYGRAMCAAYPRRDMSAYDVAPICPRAAADARAQQEAEEAEYQAQKTANQKVCDTSRHRPLIRPVLVARDRTLTDYGMLESFETEEAYEASVDAPLDRNGLVGAVPGHLAIAAGHSDYDICLTTEAYRKKPPVEVEGWDHVVEVGYQSPTGLIELMDPMDGESDLPNLAFRGKGHYRVRVHYREPDWEAWTPQHLLIMVYPGKGDRVVQYRARS